MELLPPVFFASSAKVMENRADFRCGKLIGTPFFPGGVPAAWNGDGVYKSDFLHLYFWFWPNTHLSSGADGPLSLSVCRMASRLCRGFASRSTRVLIRKRRYTHGRRCAHSAVTAHSRSFSRKAGSGFRLRAPAWLDLAHARKTSQVVKDHCGKQSSRSPWGDFTYSFRIASGEGRVNQVLSR